MEGIPRVPMFSLELLSPDKQLSPQFEENIQEYIVTTYQDDPSKYNHAFRELESMRKVLMQNIANVESVCIMKRYFAQLSMMKARFPMEENDPLAIPFSWIDRGFDFSTPVTYNDVNFEMCCVLYNIGAAHSIIAANETRSDADSIKNAFMHFQYASWPMQHLRDSMRSSKFGSMNFSSTFLTFYADMLLAQAQECILEKSIIDGRKPLVIAKVAVQLKKYYESNLSMLSILATELTSIGRYKALFRLCSAKMELYDALACYYLGVQADAEQEMGMRISYFTYALERINVASKVVSKDDRESLRQAIQFAHDVISKKEDNARKENDFIYHAKITKPQDFDVLEGVVMVKPIGFDVNDSSVCGEDLFSSLLPTDVLKTVSLYSEEKTKFRRKIVEKVQEKDSELQSYLMSLQLNQLHLDEPIESVRLPDELLSSSAAFTSQPNAFPALIDKFDGITKMASDADRKLDDLIDRIKDVETPELVNDDGFKVVKTKVQELHKHHVKARENNMELQRALAAHSENLKLLAMPLTQITKEICGEYINPMEHAEGQQLRKVLDKVDEMSRQRCQLLQTFDEDLDADDITKKALADRDYHPQELFEKELKKHEKIVNVIKQNLVAQDNILAALTEANANFSEFRRHIVEANEKRALHSLTLVTAYQVFVDVVDKTDKAIAFYKQLFSMIESLSKVVAIVEETEDKKRKEAERLLAEKRMAKESAEALQEFSLKQSPSVMSRRSEGSNNFPNKPAAAIPTAGAARPRLGDYMDYYRSKMAAVQPQQTPAQAGSGIATPEHSFRPISAASVSPGKFSTSTLAQGAIGPNNNQVPPHIPEPVPCPPIPGSYSIAQPLNSYAATQPLASYSTAQPMSINYGAAAPMPAPYQTGGCGGYQLPAQNLPQFSQFPPTSVPNNNNFPPLPSNAAVLGHNSNLGPSSISATPVSTGNFPFSAAPVSPGKFSTSTSAQGAIGPNNNQVPPHIPEPVPCPPIPGSYSTAQLLSSYATTQPPANYSTAQPMSINYSAAAAMPTPFQAGGGYQLPTQNLPQFPPVSASNNFPSLTNSAATLGPNANVGASPWHRNMNLTNPYAAAAANPTNQNPFV